MASVCFVSGWFYLVCFCVCVCVASCRASDEWISAVSALPTVGGRLIRSEGVPRAPRHRRQSSRCKRRGKRKRRAGVRALYDISCTKSAVSRTPRPEREREREREREAHQSIIVPSGGSVWPLGGAPSSCSITTRTPVCRKMGRPPVSDPPRSSWRSLKLESRRNDAAAECGAAAKDAGNRSTTWSTRR